MFWNIKKSVKFQKKRAKKHKAPHKRKVAAYVEIYSGNFGGEAQQH